MGEIFAEKTAEEWLAWLKEIEDHGIPLTGLGAALKHALTLLQSIPPEVLARASRDAARKVGRHD